MSFDPGQNGAYDERTDQEQDPANATECEDCPPIPAG
jgi:hypothetical protein